MNKIRVILILAVLAAIIGGAGLIHTSKAQEKQDMGIILTWEADSFYPADYEGKVPAIPDSKLSISATLMRDNKVINPSNKKFIWRVNDRFFNRGVGMNEISFNTQEREGSVYSVEVSVAGNKNSIDIPVKTQELVIENPRPSRFVDLGEEVTLEAVPYFFNIASLDGLSFSWQVNNITKQKQRENFLTLNIGDSKSLRGNDIMITGAVMNENNPLESADSNLTLTVR